MLVNFNQMDFPKLQFPPVGREVLPSTSVTLTSADSRGQGCPGNDHSPGDSFMWLYSRVTVWREYILWCCIVLGHSNRMFRLSG